MMIAAMLLLGAASAAIAQHDGTPQRSWTLTVNFLHGPEFAEGSDEHALDVWPARSVIERVYWMLDTATVDVDSLVVLDEASQPLTSYEPDTETPVAIVATDHPLPTGGSLTLKLHGLATATGQVTILIVWRRIE